MALRTRSSLRLITRNGNDFTDHFPFIAMAVKLLPARSCVIDGEAIVFNEARGRRGLGPIAEGRLCRLAAKQSLVARQQQNQRAHQDNSAGGDSRTDYEYSRQWAKIARRGGGARQIISENHTKHICDNRTNQNNRRVSHARNCVLRSGKAMLPIQKNRTDERKCWRQKRQTP
jgi:hypothetical protein